MSIAVPSVTFRFSPNPRSFPRLNSATLRRKAYSWIGGDGKRGGALCVSVAPILDSTHNRAGPDRGPVLSGMAVSAKTPDTLDLGLARC